MGEFIGNLVDGLGSGTAVGVSTGLFDLTAILFLISAIAYVTYLAWRSNPVWAIGFGAAAVGAAVQTAALTLRWVAAGWDHPPFTNLYESLVFFGWGIVVVYLFVELKYRVRVAGALVVPIAFFALGIASLSPDKSITPLMPALQDIWLHMHVATASIGYAAFLVAFGFAVLFLLKDNVPMERFGIATACFTILAAVASSKADVVFLRYSLTKVREMGGRLVAVTVPGTDIQARTPVPGAGEMLFVVCVLCAVCALLFAMSSKRTDDKTTRWGFSLYFVTTFLLGLFLVHVAMQSGKLPNVSLRTDVYSYALLATACFFMLLTLIFYYRRESLVELLPDTRTLDLLGYRSIIVAFPIMTFVIISGAVWANKAWGRYWGWDPKETASLITWAIYLLYLHARFTAKWSGRRAALISIVGFVSVVFTYLGVNLVLSGLHSYASN